MGSRGWAKHTYRLCFSNVYMWTNPIGMGREALTSLPEDGWNAHLSTRGEDRIELEARLNSLPDVDEDVADHTLR
jgi:hypothetical protein